MAQTQEDRKAETRARLLDAAADLFARKGFHAVSVDAVAEAADRTSGAVYAHFGDKEGLLLGLLRKWGSEAADQVGDAMQEVDDPGARVQALWEAYTHPGDDRGDAWMLLEHELWLYAARRPETGDALARRYAVARDGMATEFGAWRSRDGADGDGPVGDDGETAALVFALLLGLDMQRRIDPTAASDEVAIAGIERLLGIDNGRTNAN